MKKTLSEGDLAKMQRKRVKSYFSDNVDLGSNILPVTTKGLMRRFKMRSMLKYMVMIIFGFVLYSVYEKINLAASAGTFDRANEILHGKDSFVQQMNAENNVKEEQRNENDEVIDRRVKEEIHKVFEEFKQKQEQQQVYDNRFANRQQPFTEANVKDQKQIHAYKTDPSEILNDNVDTRNAALGQNNRQYIDGDGVHNRGLIEDNGFDNVLRENFNKGMGEMNVNRGFENGDNKGFDNGNYRNDFNENNNDANVNENINVVNKAGEIDAGDHFENVMEGVMDLINDDEEKEDIQIEEEIEHRLAEVLKDAVNEVADEQAEAADVYQGAGNAGPVQEMNEKNAEIQQVFEKKEFNIAVDQMQQRLNPIEMQRLNEQHIRDEQKNDNDHEFPPLVTSAGFDTYRQVTQLVASIQSNLPGRKIYIYDIDLAPDQKKHLMSFCGVRMRRFMKDLFPEYVKNLNNLYWKPLVIQTALAEFGHITWINPQYRLTSQQLGSVLHDSHESGIIAIGQFASYSTFSATNPKMYDFIPSNKDRLANVPHIEIRALIIHNTPEVHDNVMKMLTACALEENCLAPPGSKLACKFDFTGKKYAGCHRYDESAINILLKNWFNFDMDRFARRNSFFRDYDPRYKPNLKLCRSVRDIRDTEL